MALVANNFSQSHGYASDADAQVGYYLYNGLADTAVNILVAGYFDDTKYDLKVNDLIYAVTNNGTERAFYYVSTVVAGVVTILALP